MGDATASEVSVLLRRLGGGEGEAMDELMPLVGEELRAIAANLLRVERRDHTLQATALVNEAYLRLVGQERVGWKNRGHFFSIAARMMRRILVDYARRRQAQRRGGGQGRVPLEAVELAVEPDLDLLALDRALDRLEELDPRQARIVELRYFAGRNIEETGRVLGLSPRSVSREWHMARLFLRDEMGHRGSDGP